MYYIPASGSFWTKSADVVKDCLLTFNCPKAEDIIFKKCQFLTKCASMHNLTYFVCKPTVNANIATMNAKSSFCLAPGSLLI